MRKPGFRLHHFNLNILTILILAFPYASSLAAPEKAEDAVGVRKTLQSHPPLQGIIAISAGYMHTCALTSGGGVKCWGSSDHGEKVDNLPVDISGLTYGVAAITAGLDYSCALTEAGGVKCWGINDYGQLGDGTTNDHLTNPVDVSGLTSGVAAVTAGDNHTCALLDTGRVECWGNNQYGELGDGTTTPKWTPVEVHGLTGGVKTVVAGGSHTCAVTDIGGVKCWGDNTSGQLGDGTTTPHSTPVDVVNLTSDIIAISASNDGHYSHTCALTQTGGVKCWGYNFYGQLGDGTTEDRLTPVDVSGLSSGVTDITAGQDHNCARTSSGGVKCWGYNYDGQVGDGTTTKRLTPVDVAGLLSGVSAVDAGGFHTCALTDLGGIKCWGYNELGQIGDGTLLTRSLPMDVSGLEEGVDEIRLGGEHTCVVTTNGGVKCWGSNDQGKLGDGTFRTRNLPVDVIDLQSGVQTIALGRNHSCAVIDSGGVKCWGDNERGQLGNGSEVEDSPIPVDVSGLSSGIATISAGTNHTCALTLIGGVKCWGSNGSGQLGDGTTTEHNTPVDVIGLSSGVAAITAGYASTCALTTEGAIKCWGNNEYGGLGDGTNVNRYTPVDVIGLSSGVKAISAGEGHTCAITGTGGVKCWGSNENGKLGDGSTDDHWTPWDVAGLSSDVSAISAGKYQTCAMTDSGRILCWGGNWSGELGDGTSTHRLTPVETSGIASHASAVEAGDFHTCALVGQGRPKCWGSDYVGELGLGTLIYHLTPVDVVSDATELLVNYFDGQPGSFFTITGQSFPPGGIATITVNGQVITGTLAINETGGFIFFLNTTGADPGAYNLTASANPGANANASFSLLPGSPLRIEEGGGLTFNLPPGLGAGEFVYLPFVRR